MLRAACVLAVVAIGDTHCSFFGGGPASPKFCFRARLAGWQDQHHLRPNPNMPACCSLTSASSPEGLSTGSSALLCLLSLLLPAGFCVSAFCNLRPSTMDLAVLPPSAFHPPFRGFPPDSPALAEASKARFSYSAAYLPEGQHDNPHRASRIAFTELAHTEVRSLTLPSLFLVLPVSTIFAEIGCSLNACQTRGSWQSNSRPNFEFWHLSVLDSRTAATLVFIYIVTPSTKAAATTAYAKISSTSTAV